MADLLMELEGDDDLRARLEMEMLHQSSCQE
jgi:hypothetical protein